VKARLGRNESALAHAFTNTLVASRIQLHVDCEPLATNLLSWPGIWRCSDLRVTLIGVYLAPDSAVPWFLADKIREGRLYLCIDAGLNESHHEIWEASVQRLLLVRDIRY